MRSAHIRTCVHIALAAAVVIGGCRTAAVGVYSLLGGTRATISAFNAIPSSVDNASALALVGDDVVFLERVGEDLDSIALSRVHLPGKRIWTTLLPMPAEVSGVGVEERFDPALGYASRGREVVLHLLERNGVVSIVTYAVDDDDTAHAIVRQCDAATGRVIVNRRIDRFEVDDPDKEVDDDMHRYQSAIAPDSSFFALARSTISDVDRNLNVQRVLVARFDGTIIRQFEGTLPEDISPTPTLSVDARGGILRTYAIDYRTIRLERNGPDGDTSAHELSHEASSRAYDFELKGAAMIPEPNGSVAMALVGSDNGDEVSLQLVRYDARGGFDAHPPFVLDGDLLESLVDDDEIEGPRIARFLVTAHPKARYLLVVEGRGYIPAGSGGSLGNYAPTQATYGSFGVIVAAFDSTRRPVWQRGIPRDYWMEYNTAWQFSCSAARIDGDFIDVIYRDEKSIRMRRYRLADGSEVTSPNGLGIMSIDASGHFMRSLRWTGPATYVTAGDARAGAAILEVNYDAP